jgi:predicted nucleic acid-binding Zn ribbon protein
MPELRRSGARRPRELSLAVARLRTALTPPSLLARVQERWTEAVGERVAEQAQPVAERDAMITVACCSAGWASELTMLSQPLLEQLNRGLGEGLQVRALRFVTRPS